MCPDCTAKSRATLFRSPPADLTRAQVLRGMISGNMDMIHRHLRVGDIGLAEMELRQALDKIDLFLKSLQ